jgi:UrcA family protein
MQHSRPKSDFAGRAFTNRSPAKDVGPPATLSHWLMAETATAMNDKQRMFIMVTLKTIALSCAALAAVAVSAPSYASNAVNIKNRVVRHSDLDLSTQKDQQRLAIRIKKAIEQVCSGPVAYTTKDKQSLEQCQLRAMANVQPKVERAIANYTTNKSLAANDAVAIVGN